MPMLSGPDWTRQFPTSVDPNDCVEPFRSGLRDFLAALAAASASVHINATYRPPERAALMHFSWKVANNILAPQDVPVIPGVDIDWVHRDAAGNPDFPKSRSMASQMVHRYEIVRQPALVSRHTQRNAIDMDIRWNGDLTIRPRNGAPRTITTTPRDGMNEILATVGATYGVIKAAFANDPPHWSNDGH